MDEIAPHLPSCAAFVATSLDGFLAGADGSLDFLDAVAREGEDYGFAEFMDGVDTLVLGRVTYETALTFETWPYASKRCVVLTRNATRESRHGETFSAEPPDDLRNRLGREGSRRIYVDGGQTISSFLAADLVDELTVSILPILLGEGIPLFRRAFGERSLRLVSSDVYESGLVKLRYTRRR